MARSEIYRDMQSKLGVVPSFFKNVPDYTLEQEWELFKRIQLDKGFIPGKYRELIGLAISAVTKCKYCIFFHTEIAKLNGATDAEIEEALHYAKASVGWSTYISGLQTEFEQFKTEVRQACEHVRAQQFAEQAAAAKMQEPSEVGGYT